MTRIEGRAVNPREKSATEIEITPLMVRAGAAVLAKSFVEGRLTEVDRQDFSRRIFCAMLRSHRRPKSPR
jgi:hypothetical protein